MAKGSGFERQFCDALSLWWTGNPKESVFWRTAMSGGRATVRRKKDKNTGGHAGDVCATDSVGQDLIKVVTIEVKRGYNKHTLQDILDRKPKAKQQVYEAWVHQAVTAAHNANTPHWMIVHRRDQRDALVYISLPLYQELDKLRCFRSGSPMIGCTVLCRHLKGEDLIQATIFGFRLEDFLVDVDPGDFRALARRL